MSILQKVVVGKQSKPIRLMVAGVAGVGKSTFAAGAPKPLFLDCERRTEHLNVSRIEPEGWEDILGAMRELHALSKDKKCSYQTLVVDTLDHAEMMLWDSLCKKHKVDSIEEIGGGYGKGFIAALMEWRRFVKGVESLREAGIGVILLAHMHVRPFANPQGDPYDQWIIKLDKRAKGLLVETVDAMGFATFDDQAVKKRGELRAKGITSGERVLKFEHSAAYESKGGLNLPDQIPLEFAAFAAAMKE